MVDALHMLGIPYDLLLSVFALDAFVEGYSSWETVPRPHDRRCVLSTPHRLG